MTKNYQPLYDKVFIHRLEDEETTSPGGLILPGKENTTISRGTVVAIGHGHRPTDFSDTRKHKVAVGNIVIFPKYAGVPLDDIGVMLKEDEILAIELV